MLSSLKERWMRLNRPAGRNRFAGVHTLLLTGLLCTASGVVYAQVGQIPAQSQTGNVTVPEREMASYCEKAVSPIYSRGGDPSAQATTVVLEVIVNRQGIVRPIRVVSGDLTLGSAAMDAVRLWRYKPYLQNGAAVDVSTQVKVDFVPGRPGGLITHPANHE